MKNQRRRRAKQIRRNGGVRTPGSLKALVRTLLFATNPFWMRDLAAPITDYVSLEAAMKKAYDACERGPQ